MDFKGFLRNTQLKIEQNKGAIFTAFAIGFEIAAVVSMAKRAPKAEKILVPANKKVNKLKEEIKDVELVANRVIDPNEHKKEIRKIQRQTFLGLAKVYSLPLIFTGLSVAFMGGSYKIMKDKQIALGAAYVTVENAFKAYRNRVKDKFGEETENEIFRDIRSTKKQIVDAETGEIKELKDTINKSYSGGIWELWFDASSKLWSKNGRCNYETLMETQKQANIQLKSKHYIFLYDILMMLYIEEGCIPKDLLAASRVVGWIYDPYDPKRSSWVSFGISDEMGHYNENGRQLFDNEERDIMLSFNPDGNISLDYPYYVK